MAGTTTVTGAGRTITVVPTLPLAPEALVEVFVTRDVQDVASNALSPSNDATAVPTNGVIEVEYSEPLDPASLVLGAVTLRQEFGARAEVPSAVTLVRGGRVIRVEPATPLAATASYAVEVTTAVRDLDGVAPAAGLVSRFTTGAGDDLVTPTVVGVTPPDGAIGVGVNASLRVRFDEPVNPLTVTGATILVSDGVTAAVACTISFGAGDREVVVVPHGPLTAAAVHQVTIAGVEDLAGNPVVVRTTQFTTGTGPDTNAPTALRLAPTGTGVPITVAIEVELDEPIDPIALNSDTFQVIDTVTDLAVAGSAAVNASGSTISFVPDAPLAVGHRHSVRLSGIADVAGNIAGTISFTFTTGTAADTTGPQVVAVSPADGLADVPINARVVVAFDDPSPDSDCGPGESQCGRRSDCGQPQFVGRQSHADADPAAAARGAVRADRQHRRRRRPGGNPLAVPVQTSFTTETGVDLTRPSITAVEPASSATGVATNTAVRVQFSEQIDPVKAASAFRLINVGLITGTVAVASTGLSAIFTPDAALAPFTSHSIQLSGFTDLAGQQGFFFASFTTGAGPDTEAPAVTAVSPPAGNAAVPVNALVVLQLSEPVSALSVGPSTVTLVAGGSPVAGATSLSADRTTLTFTPSGPLAVSTLYDVTVVGLADSTGNVQPVPFATSFTTGASAVADTGAPSVVSVSPLNNATGVPVGTSLVLTFSEVIDPTSVDASTIEVTIDGFSGQVAGSYAVDGTAVTFTPLTPLPGGECVRLRVHNLSVRDLAGNASGVFTMTFVTEAVLDTTPPAVVAVTPTDGATDIGRQAKVVLTFSESLSSTTVTPSTLALFANGAPLGASLTRTADNRTVTLSAFAMPPASTIPWWRRAAWKISRATRCLTS